MHRIARRLAVLGLLPLGVAGLTLPAAHAEGGAAHRRHRARHGLGHRLRGGLRGHGVRLAPRPRLPHLARGQHVRAAAAGASVLEPVAAALGRAVEQILHGRRRSPARPGLRSPARPGLPDPRFGPGLPGASRPAARGSPVRGASNGAPTAPADRRGERLGNVVAGRRAARSPPPPGGCSSPPASGARTASCSGTAVTSANRSVVITAGHCVKSNGAFHRNWCSCRASRTATGPFGTWVATNLFTTQQWNANEDINFDIAAFVVAPLNGRNLVDVVGGQGVAFNQQRGAADVLLRLPGRGAVRRQQADLLRGPAINDPLQTNDLGLRCDMTGGSSGGPWLLAFNERTGRGLAELGQQLQVQRRPASSCSARSSARRRRPSTTPPRAWEPSDGTPVTRSATRLRDTPR